MHILLYQLKTRLALVEQRIVIAQLVIAENTADTNRYLIYTGSLKELNSERVFLTGLIADIEGVTA